MADALDRVVVAVGQGDQGFESVVDLALRHNPVGPRGVVTGLGLQDVGLVRKPHIETLVGLVQLAFERGFFRFGRCQVVLSTQDGEIVLGTLQDQVLLCGRQLQRSLFVDGLGGLQLEPAIGAKDRLSQGRRPGITAAVGGNRWIVDFGPGIQHLGTGREIWQQAGTGLGYHFLLCAIVGAGGGEVGVVVHGLLVNADQIGFR
ncbi:hypothetical protein D3C77_114920 [compost metagenome]